MTTPTFYHQSVGQIVADNFAAAHVFYRFGIDFCCHGATDFQTACAQANADPMVVAEALSALQKAAGGTPDFAAWPLDLLIDYVLKIHHRNIRRQTPDLLALTDKVTNVHGDTHPELHDVQRLVAASLADLEDHLQKEEQVLFPFLYHMYDSLLEGRRPEGFHCGSVAMPIQVMMSEHEGEGERYRLIAQLTNDYTAPADACASYRLLLEQLQSFERALHEHIHLENNIIFLEALRLENDFMK